jgi:hypothetical protein
MNAVKLVGWGWFWATRLQFKSGQEVIDNIFIFSQAKKH